MTTRWAASLAIGLLMASAAATAKVKVNTQYDKKFNFAGLRTYAWHPTGAGDVLLLQVSNDDIGALRDELEPMIMRSVEGTLARRGFTVASSAPADLYVYYYVLIGPGISSQTMGQFIAPMPKWGLPPFAPATTSLEMFEQGSLIVDVSSPALGAMVWRGTAQAEVDRARSAAAREERIRDAVEKMFKKFPPKK